MNLLEQRPVLAANVRLRTRAGDDVAVLLYPEGLVELNETARAVIGHCDGRTTTTQIIDTLAAEYDIDRQAIQLDACECVTDLLRRKLLVLAP